MNDIVKFLTQEFVKFIDTPKDKRQRKNKERWSTRWFGLIPFAVRMVLHKKSKLHSRR
jgi:hypothetical protein